ncbi:unnamed protein product, partial [marine sediment metagenome]
MKNLNYILEKADVGIIPSIWEEAYGLVGIELLAKGIPVIGNLCTVKENIGDGCLKCCEHAPKNNRYLIKKTLTYYLKRIYLYKPLKLFSVTLKRIYNLIISHKNNPALDTNYGNDLSNLFQKRRTINLNSLKKIDLLIAVSNKVNDIYKNFLKIDNIIT